MRRGRGDSETSSE